MPQRTRNKIVALVVLLLVWAGVSACSCSSMLGNNGGAAKTSRDKPIRAFPTSTPFRPPRIGPTVPPRPTVDTSEMLESAQEVKAKLLDDGTLELPSGSNQPFELTATEEQVNALLARQSYEQSGIKVEQVSVRFADSEVIAKLQATYTEANLTVGLTVRGTANAVDGTVYVTVTDVELDQSVTGLARLGAQAVVDGMIEQWNADQGIAVPIERVYVEQIVISTGQITVKGLTR